MGLSFVTEAIALRVGCEKKVTLHFVPLRDMSIFTNTILQSSNCKKLNLFVNQVLRVKIGTSV